MSHLKGAASLALASAILMATMQAACGALDEAKNILSQLESHALGPEETFSLLQRLAKLPSIQWDGLDVARLLEERAVDGDESKCSKSSLLERHQLRARLVYELGDMEALFKYLDAQLARQLDFCLELFASKLDKLFLGKLSSKTRGNVELFNELAANYETEAARERLGPMGAEQVASIAGAQFAGAKKKLDKETLKRRIKTKLAKGESLRASCARAAETLRPLGELLAFLDQLQPGAEQAPSAQLGDKLKHWRAVYAHCDHFNRRMSADLDDDLEDF